MLDAANSLLKFCQSYVQILEKVFEITSMRPKHILMTLSCGEKITISVFNIVAMILSLLTDDSLMHPDNVVGGIDIHTGKVDKSHKANEFYGEVHTEDAWEPARAHYCGPDHAKMPIALIVFREKPH